MNAAWRVGIVGQVLLMLAAGAATAGMAHAGAVASGSVITPPAVDYSAPAHWLCRPGVDDGTCSAGLDTVAADGARSDRPQRQANAPPIDCFYVYPTSSLDTTMLSDLQPDEERRPVHDQAAHFGSRCRLFVPIYHQLTIAALKNAMARSGDPARITLDLAVPYRDILAAWHHYLAHDNGGRGVVLIGHSQGALLLARLIAEEIEGQPAQHIMVAAYLAGSLTMDSGNFRVIAPCRTAGETGCVVAWSTYAADYHGPRLFGKANPGTRPICVNPARLDEGEATVKAYLRTPAGAPAGDPPYRLVEHRITAECIADAAGAALRIAVLPGPDAAWITAALPVSRAGPSWDMHPHDIDLVQGNLLDLMAAETATWLAGRGGRH